MSGEGYWDNAGQHHPAAMSGEPSRHHEWLAGTGWTSWDCVPASEVERLRAALDKIDALPVGHYRRNGCASPDPWIRQREVRRIVRNALAATEPPA